jgi:hypothetical protein
MHAASASAFGLSVWVGHRADRAQVDGSTSLEQRSNDRPLTDHAQHCQVRAINSSLGLGFGRNDRIASCSHFCAALLCGPNKHSRSRFRYRTISAVAPQVHAHTRPETVGADNHLLPEALRAYRDLRSFHALKGAIEWSREGW